VGRRFNEDYFQRHLQRVIRLPGAGENVITVNIQRVAFNRNVLHETDKHGRKGDKATANVWAVNGTDTLAGSNVPDLQSRCEHKERQTKRERKERHLQSVIPTSTDEDIEVVGLEFHSVHSVGVSTALVAASLCHGAQQYLGVFFVHSNLIGIKMHVESCTLYNTA